MLLVDGEESECCAVWNANDVLTSYASLRETSQRPSDCSFKEQATGHMKNKFVCSMPHENKQRSFFFLSTLPQQPHQTNQQPNHSTHTSKMLKRAHRELARNAIYTEVMPTGDDALAEMESMANFSDSGSDSDSSSDEDRDLGGGDSDLDSDEDAELESYIQKYEGSLKKDKKEGSDDEDEEAGSGSSDDEDAEEEAAEEEAETHFRCKICPKKTLKNETMVQVHLNGHEHKVNLKLYKKALKEDRTKEQVDKLKAKNLKKKEKALKKKEDRKAAQKQKLKEKKKRQWEKKMAAAAAAAGGSTKEGKKVEKIVEKAEKKVEEVVKKLDKAVEKKVGKIVEKAERDAEKKVEKIVEKAEKDATKTLNKALAKSDKKTSSKSKPPAKKQKTSKA